MTEIKQLSSQIVYRNRWMTVREDRIKRPSGAEGIYGVVEKPHFVVIIPYEDGKVHLVEQYRYPVQGRYWEFPQGSWEDAPGKDPEKIAAGELLEETGLVADRLLYAGFLYQGYGYSNQGYHIYFATGLTEQYTNPEPEEEDLITASFTIAQLEEMLLRGEIRDATTMAAYGLVKLKKFF
jgi:ADP-ribose pyrophosphatase